MKYISIVLGQIVNHLSKGYEFNVEAVAVKFRTSATKEETRLAVTLEIFKNGTKVERNSNVELPKSKFQFMAADRVTRAPTSAWRM